MSKKEQTVVDELGDIREAYRQSHRRRLNEAHIKSLLKQIDELERRFDALLGIKEEVSRFVIEPKQKKSKNEAVAVALASDWHVEERVDADVVNGLNRYDLQVSAFRMQNFFRNVLRLVEKERHTYHIEELVCWLGGDLMTGYIHEELIESNYLSPIEAILFLKAHLLSGIDFWLANGNFKRIVVITNHGNHGRTTEKMKVATSYKNSFEYLLYMDLKKSYERERRVLFQVAKGEFNFMQLFGVKIRTSHGYTIKYNGGVGGITVPAMKFIATQNRIERADYDVWGHHHNYFPNPYFFQNGSLIGVSAYGRRYGGELPKQGFFIVDSKNGITTMLPVFVTK